MAIFSQPACNSIDVKCTFSDDLKRIISLMRTKFSVDASLIRVTVLKKLN